MKIETDIDVRLGFFFLFLKERKIFLPIIIISPYLFIYFFFNVAVCKDPPYKVEESGYAGFILPIEVYFKNKVCNLLINLSVEDTSLTK